MYAPLFNKLVIVNSPAPTAEGAAPSKNQGNREARSAIYATAAMPIFDHVFLLFLGGSGLKLFQWPSYGPDEELSRKPHVQIPLS